MNLIWIEDLLAIAATRSLTAAAERRRIRAIEEHLGVVLVDRARRPARPAGALLERVEALRGLAARLHRLPNDLVASSRMRPRSASSAVRPDAGKPGSSAVEIVRACCTAAGAAPAVLSRPWSGLTTTGRRRTTLGKHQPSRGGRR